MNQAELCELVRKHPALYDGSWNQAVLVERLTRREVTPLVLELFQQVPPDSRMRVALLHKMCHHFVHVVFLTVEDDQLDEPSKVKRVHQCEAVLKKLCMQTTGLQVGGLVKYKLYKFYMNFVQVQGNNS